MRAALLLLLAACSGPGPETVDDTGPTGPIGPTTAGDDDDLSGGQCGEVTHWDLTVQGGVARSDGAPAVGARVFLEERNYSPGVIAEGTTDATGRFAFAAPQVTSVEDCWATLLDYWLVGELGAETGERGVNTELFDAIDGGSLVAELSFPLALVP